jgi:hypothetical protein
MGNFIKNSPTFINLPYKFTVKEGQINKLIGRLEAKDLDEDVNGQIRFEIAEENSPFKVDPITGEVSTKTALDFERQKVHTVVVTARDNGQDTRIATATMTISVQDIPDTEPMFTQFTYEVTIPENSPMTKVTKVEVITEKLIYRYRL